MKKPLFLFIFFCFCCTVNLVFGSTIEYKYDSAGNRVSRQVVLLRSAKDDNREDSIPEPPILSQLGPEEIRIAPNPTKGLLHVSVNAQDNHTDESPAELRLLLYSAQGALLQDHKTLDREISLNLSDYTPGHYILKVFLGESSMEFKIIKQ